MPAKKKDESENHYVTPRQEPATDPDARQQQLIGYADALVEQQILEGTVSPQILTHFMKLASDRERSEQRRMHLEQLKLEAQIKTIESQANADELLERVLAAVKTYSGADDDGEIIL